MRPAAPPPPPAPDGGPRPPQRISAVLPVFEEAATLPALVERLAAELRAAAPDGHEIVLVTSEAARDGTPACAAALADRQPAVRLVRQAARDPGYGRALALGVAAARLPWLLLLDADGQLDPADLPRFVAAARHADVVLGRRLRRADRLGRLLASRLYHRVAPWLVGLPSGADADCGFKLLRRDLLGDAPLASRTGVVNLELLLRARARGARVVEVPVTHRPRAAGRSRFETGLGLPTAAEVRAILRDLRELRLARRPERISVPLDLFCPIRRVRPWSAGVPPTVTSRPRAARRARPRERVSAPPGEDSMRTSRNNQWIAALLAGAVLFAGAAACESAVGTGEPGADVQDEPRDVAAGFDVPSAPDVPAAEDVATAPPDVPAAEDVATAPPDVPAAEDVATAPPDVPAAEDVPAPPEDVPAPPEDVATAPDVPTGPAGHTEDMQGVFHMTGKSDPLTSCTGCHGATLEGGAGPSCYQCHDAADHTRRRGGVMHREGGSGTCATCHGPSNSGGLGPACSDCH